MELIAATHTLDEITSTPGDSCTTCRWRVEKAVEGTPKGTACCFTAKYPVPFDEETEKFSLEQKC